MEHEEVIANFGLRNWEPARKVGVRRTIGNLRGLDSHSEFWLVATGFFFYRSLLTVYDSFLGVFFLGNCAGSIFPRL